MSTSKDDAWCVEMEPLEKRTRFQVNRVDGEEDTPLKDGEGSENDEDDAEDNASGYDTRYAKSFRHFTREALPRMDNYRNIMSIQAAYRPTLDELHNATLQGKQQPPPPAQPSDAQADPEGALKFGWIKGVLVRNMLNIWGVMLFLRLSWVVGQAGIVESVILILATSVVTTITSLSMAAISTNGIVKGGGTYYMISRSLGPEFGGSIGLIFSLANAVACAMYVVGFCESMRDLLKSLGTKILDGGVNDMRIVGVVTIFVLLAIVVVGMEWESKAQMVLLVILLAAIVDFIIGTCIGPLNDEDKSRGFEGYSSKLIYDNMFPDYRFSEGMEHNFFSVFAVFFPAATGILAGANISGDLKDPQSAIPKGTLLSVLITTLTYLLMAVMAGMTVHRDASGNVTELMDGSYTNCTYRKCEWGLMNSNQVVEMVSGFGPLIYAGCFAATISSALASLVSAPKVFQALCRDNLYPYISWFAKGYGKNSEPVRGYILTFFIAVCFILIGELNAIAPLISNFFLAAYALINFSTFHASLAKPLGWRPKFKYYNMWLSLVGAVICVVVMFLISWWTALVTLAVELALYLIVAYRKPDVNWGSSTQAQMYKAALMSVQQLNNVEDHVKNYRPQILVLSGMPSHRPPLVDFAYLLTKNLSLMLCGHIIWGPLTHRERSTMNHKAQNWLRAHKIKSFYAEVDEMDFEEGTRALLQASGVGKLRPNVVLLGYKADWSSCDKSHLASYFNVIHKALDMYMAVGILRLQNGLDYSKMIDGTITANGTPGLVKKAIALGSLESLPRNQSFSQLSQGPPASFFYPTPRADILDIRTDDDLKKVEPCTATGRTYTLTKEEIVETSPCLNEVCHNLSENSSSESDISAPETPNLNDSRVSTDPNAKEEKIKTVSRRNRRKRESRSDVYRGPDGAELPKSVINALTQFQRKQKKGSIDVWWLYDDGGLTLLLPYIINSRRNWASCKLRVFALANKMDELDLEQRGMASLLAKFRIDYSALKIIPDITKKPQDSTVSFFENLISNFVVSTEDADTNGIGISESELLSMKDRTNRHLRLRELLMENSMDANLVVMTLPMPRKSVVSASLYMAWLETLTRDMPPFFLVRGNQTSVLTFYS